MEIYLIGLFITWAIFIISANNKPNKSEELKAGIVIGFLWPVILVLIIVTILANIIDIHIH